MTTILVTGVGGDIGRDIVRCLKESPTPYKIVGIDMDPYAVGLRLVDAFLQAPSAREAEAYTAFIRATIARHNVEILCPSTEVEIDFFNRHRARFADVQLLMQTETVLSIASNKERTASWLKDAGLPFPRTFDAAHYDGEVGWPAVLKSRTGHGNHAVFQVRDKDELRVFRSRISDPIVQELVGTPDEEYTVGVFSDGKDIRDIQFRRTLGFGGLSRKAERVHDPLLSALVRSITTGLSMRGAFNIQLRKTKNAYVVFEINPRFSSTVFIRHHLGFTDVLWWVDLLQGRMSFYVPDHSPVVAVRMISEEFFQPTPSPERVFLA